SLQNTPEGTLDLPGLTITRVDTPQMTAKFDLSLLLKEQDDRIVGVLIYAGALFEPATARRYLEYWRRLLDAMVEDEAEAVDRLPLLEEAERRQILDDWNRTEADYPREKCIHELFEAQVEARPEAVALICENQSLSYEELNARANRLARRLRELGVGPDARVAICMERGLEMVVALLATLKAGGAYAPLDPAYPPERLAYMLEDCAPAVLITYGLASEKLTRRAPALPILDLDSDAQQWKSLSGDNLTRAETGLDTRSLAYVIYTSGSTGAPKGVMIRQDSALNLLTALSRAIYAHYDPHLRVSLNAPLAFDASVKQLVQLLAGHTLCVIPEDMRLNGAALLNYIESHQIEVFDCTPSQLRLLLEARRVRETRASGSAEFPRVALVGGEAIDAQLWRQMGDDTVTSHYNVYGPTECTVDATAGRVGKELEHPTIGSPLANTAAHILDAEMRMVPIGVTGELYLGGAGVAQGYLNRPDLTAERFLPDPYGRERGGRVYRTGDLGRWLPDGVIEFLGRNDSQVKVRGFRIELGEIEAGLTSCPGVREAVVMAREDDEGSKRLVAYYTGEEIGAEALRSHLSSMLPEYMLPTAYARLQALPLTPNGKLDWRRLPVPEGAAYVRRGYEPPEGETETELARIWAETLGLDRVGRYDNFFELGGHSLLAVKLVNQCKQMQIAVSIADLFTHPTIESLAACVQAQKGELFNKRSAAIPLRTGGAEAPLFLVHDISGEMFYGPKLTPHLAPGFPVYGLVAPSFSETPLLTVQAMAARMARMIRATQPDGPYRLAGWSFGATLAYEIATQLIGDDATVEFLGSIDGYYLGPGTNTSREALPDDLAQAFQERSLIPAELSGDEAQQYVGRYRSNMLAARSYVAHPIPIPLHLFAAEETEGVAHAPALRNWEVAMPAEQIRLISVPGNHLSMMEPSHIESLGEALSRTLRQARETVEALGATPGGLAQPG
ncbi:MAG TPA: amino acid adenylation domain-containing protein, partial [Blastocatellia bacterium]|nr:amino acid adenylation domain-containing protein [Blastocatellia bacterium]